MNVDEVRPEFGVMNVLARNSGLLAADTVLDSSAFSLGSIPGFNNDLVNRKRIED